MGNKNSPFKMVWRQFKKNRLAMFGLGLFIALMVVALTASWIAPYGFDDQDVSRRFLSPCAAHWFGTDNLGRDIFSRVLHGAKVSMSVGLISTAVSASVGVVLGSFAGYFGRKTDNIIMRILDVFMAMPQFLMAIVIAAVLGPGLINCMISVGVSGIPAMARVARASVLTQSNQEYIEAARSINASHFRIILRHVLLNAMSPILVRITMGLAGAITAAASLSFIGLGIQPPNPEWGAMLAGGREYLTKYPWIVMFPGIAIMISVFAMNIIGDGLRDALDPRLKD